MGGWGWAMFARRQSPAPGGAMARGTRGCFPGSGVAPVSGNVAGAAETAARGQGMLRDGSGMRMQPSRKEAFARMLPSGSPWGPPAVCVFPSQAAFLMLFCFTGPAAHPRSIPPALAC